MASQSDPNELGNPTATEPGTSEYDGSLLDRIAKDPEGAAKQALLDFDQSTTLLKPQFAQWKINRARLAGYTGMRLVKVQNEQRAFFPQGSVPSQTTTNKAARLARRLRSTIFTDPAVPDAIPASDDDEDRDAAETATRVLTDVCGNHNLAYNLTIGDAFDLASTHGSGYVRFWVDPTAGGRDEESGEWLPMVRRELLTGRNVRLIPDSASDIWDARGAMIGTLTPLSDLKKMFPKIFEGLDDDAVGKLPQYRPQQSDELLPVGRKDRTQRQGSDDALVFVLTIIHEQDAGLYPEGCYAILIGGDIWAHSGPWADPNRKTALKIPLTQVMQIRDPDNPNGRGIMEFLGPGNEVRQTLESSMDEHLRRFTNRKTFVPIHSNLQPEQLQAETRTYIPIVPNGAPVNEEVPDFPQATMEAYDMITREMDDESGLQEAGQGLESSSVRSGAHAQQIVSQVNVGLATMAEYSARAIERGWEIILQQIRAFVDTKLVLRWQSESGDYKVKRWEASDLGATTDVRIQKGSFTQLSQMHKADTVIGYMQQQVISPRQAQHLIAGQVGPIVGLQDDPFRQRVRRQIAMWEDGPDPNAPPAPPQMDPQTGQPIQGPDPIALQIFQPLPVDEQPDVALVRVEELGRALCSVKFERKPPQWQMALLQAYEASRVAAGIQTVKDQQQAAQQQQEAQMQAAQQQQEQVAAQQQAQTQGAQVAQALQQFGQQLEAVGQAVEQTAQGLQQTSSTVDTLGAQVGTTIAGMQRELDAVRAVALAKSGNGEPPHHGPIVVDASQSADQEPMNNAVAAVTGAVQQLAEAMRQRPTKFRTITQNGQMVGAEAVPPEGV